MSDLRGIVEAGRYLLPPRHSGRTERARWDGWLQKHGEELLEAADELVRLRGPVVANRHLEHQRDEARSAHLECQARVAELEQRREELLALVRAVSLEAPDAGEARDLRGQVARLIAEVGTLRSTANSLETALRKYGRHDDGCPASAGGEACYCGLDAAGRRVQP